MSQSIQQEKAAHQKDNLWQTVTMLVLNSRDPARVGLEPSIIEKHITDLSTLMHHHNQSINEVGPETLNIQVHTIKNMASQIGRWIDSEVLAMTEK